MEQNLYEAFRWFNTTGELKTESSSQKGLLSCRGDRLQISETDLGESRETLQAGSDTEQVMRVAMKYNENDYVEHAQLAICRHGGNRESIAKPQRADDLGD